MARRFRTIALVLAVTTISAVTSARPTEAQNSLVVQATITVDGNLLTATGLHRVFLSEFEPDFLGKEWDLYGTLSNSVAGGFRDCYSQGLIGYGGPPQLSCVTSISYSSCAEAFSTFRGSSLSKVIVEPPSNFSAGVVNSHFKLASPRPMRCQPACI